jgi:hypothetical protein
VVLQDSLDHPVHQAPRVRLVQQVQWDPMEFLDQLALLEQLVTLELQV